MPDLSPDQAIQTLRGLPEDRQRAILAKLSPEAKQGIFAKLKPPSPPEQPSATSRFTSSAVAPVVGAVKGMLDARPNEAEKAKGLTSSYDFWMRPAERVVEAQTGQVDEARDLAKQGRYSEAAAHGIASVVPLVGPWVADAAQQYYDQLGRGDTAGALGTATGNMAIALAPKAVGKGYSALKATSETLRKGAQASVGAGARAVKHTVGEEAEAANTAREKTLAANKAADESTLKGQGKVDEKNTAALAEEAKVNTQLARRTVAQKELETVSSNMDVAAEKARHDALEVGNKKYSGVNEKLSHLPADMERTHSLYQDASEAIGDVQAEPPILKRLGKALERGDALTYRDQQALYSELGKELSKGTLPGSTYHAYDILHEGIGEDMQRMADSQGQGAELTDARSYWRRMKQTFGKSSEMINNRAGKAVRSANPDLIKNQSSEYRLRLLSSFDPEIGNMAKRADALRQELASLPKKAAPAVRTEYAEPNPTTPTERPEVNTRAMRQKLLDRWSRGEEGLNKWQVRALVAGPIGGMIGFVLGHGGEGAGIGYGIGSAVGPAIVARLVETPAIREWLTRPPATELATLQGLPYADRIRITDGLRQVASVAQKTGVRVSPLLMSVLGSAATVGPKTKQLQATREQQRQATQ
jgi:hypothetical protein